MSPRPALLLELHGVSIALGSGPNRYPVLRDFNFTMNSGELVVIIGDSGAGKSTLLHFLAGLLVQTSGWVLGSRVQPGFIPCSEVRGTIKLDGVDITHRKPQSRSIGLVLQHHSIYEHMSVQENLAFPLRLKGWPTEEIRQAVAQIAEKLELQRHLDFRPKDISGGQLQRVALGKLLLKRPTLALLDEAFAHLDPLIEEEITRMLISQLNETATPQGLRGVIIVTHDITQIVEANRVVLFRRIVSDETEPPHGEVKIFGNGKPGSAFEEIIGFNDPPYLKWCDLIRNRVKPA